MLIGTHLLHAEHAVARRALAHPVAVVGHREADDERLACLAWVQDAVVPQAGGGIVGRGLLVELRAHHRLQRLELPRGPFLAPGACPILLHDRPPPPRPPPPHPPPPPACP